MNRKDRKKQLRINLMILICFLGFAIGMVALVVFYVSRWQDDKALQEQQKRLLERKAMEKQEELYFLELPTAGVDFLFSGLWIPEEKISILPEYQSLYEENQDLIGWLKIEDTLIDYPVMQTPEDENYYLYLDFDKKDNINGSLILDTDSNAGVGVERNSYLNGAKPSTNLIIHGHTMKSGQMFGDLKLYKEEEYGKSHNIICFDSLYEKREYELIAVFYSEVFYQSQQVFKYYNFFQADTQEEFDDWYTNVKDMSLYDTGVTAELGDEFITLSCCSYHVEDGRFVVVGKRVRLGLSTSQ